ncbi:MAG: hypothetical protein HQL67_11540 [Magnetococcales bacterium]|nr:hypothetical protein [Magnetococcales bacterium]
MSLVKELQWLIQTDGEIAGRVISVSGTDVVVATTSGKIEVSTKGVLRPGDMVTVIAGLATKKQRGGNALVYFV